MDGGADIDDGAGIDGIGDASADDAGGINEGPDEVVDGEVDGSVGDGSDVVGFSDGVVDGVVDGKLLGTVAGALGSDGCVVSTGTCIPGLVGTGNALGELTICAGILVELGSGFDGTEGTDTLVESPCILDDNSSDGTLGVEVAGAEGNVDGELGCGVTLGRTGG